MSPVRTLVVWCPHWPVLAAGRALDEPVAVLAAGRVVASSPAARHQGVTVGLRRREAQARCVHLEVIDRDPAAEARRFEAVLAAVEGFCPRLDVTFPGSCALATRGPSRYFGGDRSLAARIAAAVDEVLVGFDQGARSRVGVADGPFAAALAARSAREQPLVVTEGAAPAFLAGMSLTVLDRPEIVGVLERLGLGTLGELAALPAGAVTGRFGAAGVAVHRLAAGLDEHPPHLTTPPPDLATHVELDPPATRADMVAFAARGAADELDGRLGALGLSCVRLLVRVETEHGEVHERLWRHEGALGPGAVVERVRWQLDGWLHGPSLHRPSAGVVHLTLAPDQVLAATGRQLGFWGGEVEATERAARALGRVEAMLGVGVVTVPEHRGGRMPTDAFVGVPPAAVDLSDPRRMTNRVLPAERAPQGMREPAVRDALVGAGRDRPLWPGSLPGPAPACVHDPPRPTRVVDAGGGPVTVDGRALLSAPPARICVDDGPWWEVEAWAGPWPLDERWWDPRRRRRRARLQVLDGSGRAHLLAIEQGRWWCDSTYD